MATQRQIDANRLNSLKSTGAKTAEGQAKSSMNATKHGCYSKKMALVREEGYAFENRRMKWMAIADAQNDREEFLVYLNVCQSFDLDHVQRAQVERVESLVENSDQDEREDVYKLGKRLFFDPHGATVLYGIEPYFNHKKKTSENGEPINPNDPTLLVSALEKTEEGCEWLRSRWQEIRARLEPGRYLLGHHRLKSVRLLGRQPIQAIEDKRVAQIFVASHALCPIEEGPFGELVSDFSSDQLEKFEMEVSAQWPDLISLDDKDKAREVLIDLTEQSMARLDELLKAHAEKADVTSARTVNRLRLDATPEGKSLRAYKSKCTNAYYRGLAACEKFEKTRKGQGGRRKDDVDLSWAKEELPIPSVRWKEAGGGLGNEEREEAACRDGDDVRDDIARSGDHIDWNEDTDSSDANGADGTTGGAASDFGCSPEQSRLELAAEEEGGNPVPASDECAGSQGGEPEMRRSSIAVDGDIRTDEDRNEANFDENVITVQSNEPVEVTTNSGGESGLDNVAGMPRDGQRQDERHAQPSDSQTTSPRTEMRQSSAEFATPRSSASGRRDRRAGGRLQTSMSKRERRRMRRERVRIEVQRRASNEAEKLKGTVREVMGDIESSTPHVRDSSARGSWHTPTLNLADEEKVLLRIKPAAREPSPQPSPGGRGS